MNWLAGGVSEGLLSLLTGGVPTSGVLLTFSPNGGGCGADIGDARFTSWFAGPELADGASEGNWVDSAGDVGLIAA